MQFSNAKGAFLDHFLLEQPLRAVRLNRILPTVLTIDHMPDQWAGS